MNINELTTAYTESSRSMTKEDGLRGKTILLVNPGSARKIFILERLKALGLVIVCLHKEKTALAEPYVDYWITGDLKNFDECIRRIQSFNEQHKTVSIDGVVTFWDECTLLTARIAEEFQFVSIPLAVAEKIKNKYLFRDSCKHFGIPSPRHQLISRPEEFTDVDAAWRFPLVIKPVYGASSAFVVKVENKDELEKAFVSIKDNIHSYELAPEWKTWEVFVEEYIGGDEVDIDLLLQDGAIKYSSITDNNKTNEPFFVETGETCPSMLPVARQRELLDMSKKTLRAFGVKNGCFHFEAKSTCEGAVPIEINMRMGGGDVYLYSREVWGVDLIENAVKIALGIPVRIEKPEQPFAYLVALQFLPERSGVLKELIVDERLKQKNYFVELYFQKNIGDTFLAPPDGYDSCLGWLTVKGATFEEARKNLSEGITYVRYSMEDLPS